MNQQKFIDRINELNYLNEKYKENRSQLIVIYGRRRIGKTELVLQFSRKKPSIYFLCEKTTEANNIRKLKEQFSIYLNNPSFNKLDIKDFEDLFLEFIKWKKTNEKVIIILDEFPFLIELNRGITSVFQRIWDLHIHTRNDIMLILCGSSIGMMESELLAYKSPLYGRRTGQIKLDEIEFKYLHNFLNYDIEDLIKVYSSIGGIPQYWLYFDEKKKFWENIEDIFLKKGGYLYEEVDFLLREEFREPKNYKLILSAISEGYRKIGEISNATGLDKSAVSRYIDTLEHTGIVYYELPILMPEKSKRRMYYIKDPLFMFWFKFIYPNKGMIEANLFSVVKEKIKNEYDTYLGIVFERIAKNFFIESKVFNFTKIGRFLCKDTEIDLVALNDKEVAFIEVKWKILSALDARNLINKLQKKASVFEWNKEKRKEYFGIIAKRIENKKELRKEGFFVFDLGDFKFQK